MAILDSYASLLGDIKQILQKARHTSYTAVNTEMLKAYFEIGEKIVEQEQEGKERAEYGVRLLEAISEELIRDFGKGYGVTTLKNMRSFYKVYKNKIGQSVTDEFFKLSWTHYCELLKIGEV